MINKIEETIYQVITSEKGRPIPAGKLMQKVKDILNTDNKSQIYGVIDNLVAAKKLKKTPGGSLLEGYLNGPLLPTTHQGVVSINSNLDGYVKVVISPESKTDYFVHFSNLNGAVNNDEVEIQVMDKFSKNTTQHAVITKVLAHNTKFVVGKFELIGNQYNIALDDKRNYLTVKLDTIDHLVNGHKLLIEIGRYEHNIAYGTVSRILGHVDDVGIDIVSIVAAHNITVDFSPETIQQANKLTIDPDDNNKVRIDLTERLIVTIDPAGSKDLDDAIHVSRLPGNKYLLSVSIADVSNYVNSGSLYKEATERATSVYLVDRVIPMLPHYLSNNICSLNPNEPRLALTCDVVISENGEYSDINVYPSVIKTAKRFSYDEVNEYYKDSNSCNWNDELKQMLNASYELHQILRKIKHEHGYIDFDLNEPTIIVDEKCWPIDIQIKQRGHAQKMIEDFMITANECVTLRAQNFEMPFIFRVHGVPQIEKLRNFALEAKKLGFHINLQDLEDIKPHTLTKWLEKNENNANIHLISKLLLRCMPKAYYSEDNIGHFGLGSKTYTHFTSPIRRLPDLIIHRIYWMYQFNYSLFTDAERDAFAKDLKHICEHATAQEINAQETEREVNQLKFCQYLSKKVGQVYKGTISSIKSFGMFIELHENTIEGLVRINNLGKDFWNWDSNSNTIVGQRTSKVFSFGQTVEVRVSSVDISTRQINFEIIGFEPEQRQNNFNLKRQNNRSVKRY